MSRYSDHSTVGGQVLAHRVRMMRQNWSIVWIIGRASFLLSFVFCMMRKWSINDIWNYLVCLKAVYRSGMVSLPSSLFSHSTFWLKGNRWREMSDYKIAEGVQCLQFKAEFESYLLYGLELSVCIGIASMIFMVIVNKYFGKSLSDSKELLSGRDYIEGAKIKKYIKEKSDITLANIPYPKETECRHTIITGTTGSGKTNVMIELLDQIVSKNEKVVIVDTVGTFIDRYYKKGRDIILNPLASDHVCWSFLKECTEDILVKNVAACFIDSGTTHDKFWEDAARIVFEETAKKAIRERKTTDEFLDILLKVSMEEIQEYLKGTYGHSLMDKRADKMAISIRATLINTISIFDVLKESSSNNFSIRDWIATPVGDKETPEAARILFLSCTPAQRATMIPIITAWLSIATEYLLHMNPTTQRTWFFIDELHNLRRLPKIETSLAEVRKFGGCFVIGTQMISQLNAIYGHETARTITGLCGTKVVMNIPEPETARYMSNFLGEKEEITTTEAISYGANTIRDGVNIAQKTDKKQTVPYTEIMDLKTGEAFVRFSGVDLITKTSFKFHKIDTKKKEKTKIITLQDYVSTNAPTGNELLLYGVPLNDSVLSRPIYVFDDDISRISDLLQEARRLNKKIIVFEGDSKIYDSCFQEENDILLNHHHKNGHSWNLLGELNNDYIAFVHAITDIAALDDGDRKNVEQCLIKLCSRINEILPTPTTSSVLNKLVFQSFKKNYSVLEALLASNETDIFKKYSEVRDYLALKQDYLKPQNTSNKEISIKQFLESEKRIFFISCFNNQHMEKTSRSIFEYAQTRSTLKNISNIDMPKNSKNTIINAIQFKDFLDTNANIFASYNERHNRNFLKRTFKPEIPDVNASILIKLSGNEQIIAV
jgi:type IV conjugative transfer system coupling protein TraD